MNVIRKYDLMEFNERKLTKVIYSRDVRVNINSSSDNCKKIYIVVIVKNMKSACI